MRADLFEVTSTEIALASRRLTTPAQVQALGVGSGADTVLNSIIDRISALAVRYCNLAIDIGAKAPTFASETCQATWFKSSVTRSTQILLPWRVPITSITSVVEDGTTLTVSTDYRLTAGGILLRLSNDGPVEWNVGKIVVVYVAGWSSLSSNVPPDIEARVIDQVKMEYLSRARDGSVRSETVPDVYQAAYGVAGGDSVGDSGLLVSLEGALEPYRSIAVA